MKSLKLLIFSLITLTACTHKSAEPNLKDYYFPYEKFKNPKTYCYVNLNDTTEKAYWIVQFRIQGTDSLLCTTILDTHKQKSELMTERLSAKGSEMIQYELFNNGESTNCKIIESSIAKWSMLTNQSISWKVEFSEFKSKQPIELTKNRTLIEIDTTNQIATFKDKMSMLLKTNRLMHQYDLEVHYQKGIGLIEYKIFSPGRAIKDFRLIE